MKKKWVLLIILVIIAMMMLSCNLTKNIVALVLDQDQQSQSEENDVEEAQTDQDDEAENKEEDVEEKEEEEQSDTEILGLQEIEWNSEIPSIYPEFTGGQLVMSNFITEDKTWSLGFYEVTPQEIDEYKDLLLDQKWVMDAELGMSVYEFTKEDKKITVLAGAEENSTHFVSLYLEGMDDNQGHPDSELNYNNMNGGEIPEDYPLSFIPLEVTDVTILDAESIHAAGTQIFSIVYGTSTPIEEESAKIKMMLEASIASNGGQLQDIMGMMYMGTIGEWDVNVAIGDGTADGFTTLVTYIVTENQ